MDDDDQPVKQVVSIRDVRVTDVLAKWHAHGVRWHSVIQIDAKTGRVYVRSEQGSEFWQAACVFDRRYSRDEAKAFKINWRVSPAQRPRKEKK